MEDTTPGEQIEKAVNAAIAEALAKFDDSFLLKWVAVVEVMQEDGERGLWTLTSKEIMRWDVKGMLGEALDRDRACHYAHHTVEHLREG